jgi:hypothetical protein
VLDGAELVLDGVALGAAALLLPLLQAAAASAAAASGTARIHRRTTQLRACVRSAGIGDLHASLPVPSAWSPAQLVCSLPLTTGRRARPFIPPAGSVRWAPERCHAGGPPNSEEVSQRIGLTGFPVIVIMWARGGGRGRKGKGRRAARSVPGPGNTWARQPEARAVGSGVMFEYPGEQAAQLLAFGW